MADNIIKCLKICANSGDCGKCKYHEYGYSACVDKLMLDAAQRIKRLEKILNSWGTVKEGD